MWLGPDRLADGRSPGDAVGTMIPGAMPSLTAAARPEADIQADIFGQSGAYERFMGRWSAKLAPLLVTFAGIAPDESVLDVGSGTGELALAVAEAEPSARITGVDRSAAYIAYAHSRVSSDRMRFVVGDAQRLEFADGTFDRVLSLLAMNFIPDPAKALREMARVTRPGGTVAAAVWDYGEGMQMLRYFWDEAVASDPSVAARDERHLPLSRQGELGGLWRAGGLVEIDEQPIAGALSFASFDDYWLPFLGGQGPAGACVAALSQTDRERLRLRLRQRLLGDGPDRPLELRARAWAVKGIVAR